MALVFIFVAWVVTGGPNHPIAHEGPFITPVTRSGEEQQGYRYLVPANPIDPGAYPKQVTGASDSGTSKPDPYQRTGSSISAPVAATSTNPDPYQRTGTE